MALAVQTLFLEFKLYFVQVDEVIGIVFIFRFKPKSAFSKLMVVGDLLVDCTAWIKDLFFPFLDVIKFVVENVLRL